MTSTHDLDSYRGRIGNLYTRHGLCPPFALRHAVQGWMARDIPVWHCVDIIERYLTGYGRSCPSGSGDRNFAWLSEVIETKWYNQSFVGRPRPARKQSHPDSPDDEYDAVKANQRPGRAAEFTARPPHPALKPDSFAPDGIALRQKGFSTSSSPSRTKPVPQPPRAAFTLSGQTLAPTPKKIDAAVAWLRAELAAGERVAAEVEAEAHSVGIASRTYDRARQRLSVSSRRSGFGRGAKYMMALPAAHDNETPSGVTNDASVI
jgi:hypothetical protein